MISKLGELQVENFPVPSKTSNIFPIMRSPGKCIPTAKTRMRSYAGSTKDDNQFYYKEGLYVVMLLAIVKVRQSKYNSF